MGMNSSPEPAPLTGHSLMSVSGDIQLTFINRSDITRGKWVVFFHKDVVVGFNPPSFAWKVIALEDLSVEHPFLYPAASQVTARDSFGNYMPRLPVSPGELYHVKQGQSGHELWIKGRATSDLEIQVENDLEFGYIDAFIIKAGRLLAGKTSIAPRQKAVFHPKPFLFVGLSHERVVEGQRISTLDAETGLALDGLVSAHIVLDERSAGEPRFFLEREVKA